ncbi:hypothetical protein [Rhodococcus qingshengii]|uniref:hypothetical protein n=1 Tax=Rhodococcus qingshengii TaxID=334542 RepID=UPI0021B0DCDB|nr:hypothetical protein [Rhodococcus qingshengii]MCT6735313.1 hypothetical protein [Rhodococcus qingshengii]
MTTAKPIHLRPVSDEARDPEDKQALVNLGGMLDALDMAQFSVLDAVEALKQAYKGAATTKRVEKFLADEAAHQDIVNHLADAARSIRAARALSSGIVTRPNNH